MSAKILGMIWDYQFSPAEQIVMLALADHADHEGGSIFPSVPLVAWKTGYSDRQVQRIIKGLVLCGVLCRVKEKHPEYGTNWYRIDFSKCQLKQPFVRGDKMSPGDKAMSLPGVTNDAIGGDTQMSPDPSFLNHHNNHIGEAANAPALSVTEEYDPTSWYAVHTATKKVGIESYNDQTVNQKRAIWLEKGYALVLGASLNTDPLYHGYKRKTLWDAVAECGFGIKLGDRVAKGVAKRVTRLAEQVADCESMLYEDALHNTQVISDVYRFFATYKECRPTADLPINEIGPSWTQWRNGLMKKNIAPKDRYASPQVTDVIYKKEW